MNKKYIAFGLMGFFAIAFAAAAIIDYYGSVEQEITIESPITVTGDTPELIDGYAGASYEGNDIVITNNAPFNVEVALTNDAPEGVEVEYEGLLTLSKKIVDFESTSWDLSEGSVEVEYTVVGDNFNAEVVSPLGGYELVYYKDNSDRFNNPATAIAIADVEGNLPYAEDGNADEYEMCVVEGYSNCHGAKIWYVPSDAVTEGVIDWSRASEFYFETNLVQYNAEGDLTIYSDLTVKPIYSVDPAFVGTELVTTTVSP